MLSASLMKGRGAPHGAVTIALLFSQLYYFNFYSVKS